MRGGLTDTQRGIALMEVLVSVSLIAIGFGTLLWSISNCARSQSAMTGRETGRFLAERQILLLRQQPPSGQNKELGGDFAAPYESYSWKARLETPADQSPFVVVGLAISRRTASQVKSVYSIRTILNAST